MSKAAFENALQAWVVAASGLAADKVVWAKQRLRTLAPYISLDLTGPQTLSHHSPERWHKVVVGAPAGQEIEHYARDNERWSLLIQAFAASTSGDADGASLLKKLKDALKLDGALATLRAAGITVQDVGDVKDVSLVIETGWQDRAAMTLSLLTADVSTERTTFIETVDGAGEDDLADVTI